MRERLSGWVNVGVFAWGSPYGVALTVLLCVAGHALFTWTGAITSASAHYLVGLSEIAMIGAAMILHNGIVGDKATHVKLDAHSKAADGVGDELLGIEDLPEAELDRIRQVVHGKEPQ